MQCFHFKGKVPSSKSIVNRLMIVRSFFSDLEIDSLSVADDVVLLEKALQDFKSGQKVFHCGEGGTTFRFLALRVSRQPGSYKIYGHHRLFERPQEELIHILKQLGVEAKFFSDHLSILSSGWQMQKDFQRTLTLTSEKSSQFATAILLSGFLLEDELEIFLPPTILNYGYFKMTLDLLRNLGVQIQVNQEKSSVTIPNKMQITCNFFQAETDLSSAFPIACLGALLGKAEIDSFPSSSLQPDFKFVHVLQKTGASVQVTHQQLLVQKTNELRGIQVDIDDSPDLFPVLCAYLSFCQGASRLTGLSRLSYKESDRLAKTKELLDLMKVSYQATADSFVLSGVMNRALLEKNEIIFDAENDHRMAMAAQIFVCKGFPLKVQNSQSITKSFPEFYEYVQRSLKKSSE